MNSEFPSARFRKLDDVALVELLVYDPVARIDVVEFFYREYGEVLLAVAIAVVKSATGRCNAEDYDELASLVVESIAELLEYGARPHPTFRAVADGEAGAELALVPYVKQIVRNKIHQGWRRQVPAAAGRGEAWSGIARDQYHLPGVRAAQRSRTHPRNDRRDEALRRRARGGRRLPRTLPGSPRLSDPVRIDPVSLRKGSAQRRGALHVKTPSRPRQLKAPMSANNDQYHSETPIPSEARIALRRRGDLLLRQLESMRREKDEEKNATIEPLDPQAELALRRCGDSLLSDLADRRAELAPVPERRRWHRSWAAVAAGLVAMVGLAWWLARVPAPPPAVEHPVAVAGEDRPEGEHPYYLPAAPAIPEPSSTLLALAGAVVLIVRRHR